MLIISTLNPLWTLSDTASSASDGSPTDTNPGKKDETNRSKVPSKRNVELTVQGDILMVRFISSEGYAFLNKVDGYTGNIESYSFDTSVPFTCILSTPQSGSTIIIETEKGNRYSFEI